MNNHSDDERTARRQARKTFWRALGLGFLGGLGGGTAIVKHPDERIAATTQKWAAWSGAFLSIALGIDMFVRIVILKKDFPAELCLIWMINLFVVGIGQIKSGVPAVGAVGKWSWKTSGLMMAEIALLVPAVLWLMGMVRSWQQYALYVVFAGLSSFAMLLIMRLIYDRWERRALGPESAEEDPKEEL